MGGEMKIISVSILLLAATSASASYFVPDSLTFFRQCVGPDCPVFSLPMTMEKPGAQHSMNCSKGDVVPHPSECKSFYLCRKNGTGIKLTCTFGYAFHPRIKQCVPESLVKSCGKVYCPPSIIVGTVPDPNNCTRYYRCVYGMPMHYQCESGFIFDEELGKCLEHTAGSAPSCVNGEIENPTTENSFNSTTTTEVPEVNTEEVITKEPVAVPTSSDIPFLQ